MATRRVETKFKIRRQLNKTAIVDKIEERQMRWYG